MTDREASLPDLRELLSFRHAAGYFDTAGPVLLASPRHALYYSSKALGPILGEYEGTAEEKFQKSGAAFWLPLGYLSNEDLGSHSLWVGGDVKERVINGAVFAHEAHHFLNICSSPIGHLLHLAQTTLSLASCDLLRRLSGFAGVETMPLPLATASLQAFQDPGLRDYVSALLAQHVTPFLKLHSALSGQLDMDGTALDELEAPPGVDAVIEYYSLIDRLCGSTLATHLDGVAPEKPRLVVVGSSQIVAQLGSLQLAEFIGWSGEHLWLEWARQLFAGEVSTDPAFHEQIEASVKRLYGHDRHYRARYRLPLVISRQILGKDIGLTPAVFAAWMALLTPLDPRTVHLVPRYGMGWKDLHPGHRFFQILDVMKAQSLNVDEPLIEFRPRASRCFDMVAEALGWPRFDELVTAMGTRHAIEKHALFAQLRDPYGAIYTQINAHRSKHPWCDIVPGGEFFEDDPLYIPVVVSGGTLSVCNQACGVGGIRTFTLARISDLMIFGDQTLLVAALFANNDVRELVDAICESAGFSSAYPRMAWQRLQDGTAAR